MVYLNIFNKICIHRYNVFLEYNAKYIGQILQLFVLCINNNNNNNQLIAQNALQKLINKLYNFNNQKANSILLKHIVQLIESDNFFFIYLIIIETLYKMCEGFHNKNIDDLIKNNNKFNDSKIYY